MRKTEKRVFDVLIYSMAVFATSILIMMFCGCQTAPTREDIRIANQVQRGLAYDNMNLGEIILDDVRYNDSEVMIDVLNNKPYLIERVNVSFDVYDMNDNHIRKIEKTFKTFKGYEFKTLTIEIGQYRYVRGIVLNW